MITITVKRPMADGSFTNTATINSTTIGDPDRRFTEDKLRMSRAVRFAAVTLSEALAARAGIQFSSA